MKLKKIVSLALAGVLAVSMLAGCKNGTGSSSSTTEQPAADDLTSLVIAELNDDTDVDFTTADAELKDALQVMVDNHGTNASKYTITNMTSLVPSVKAGDMPAIGNATNSSKEQTVTVVTYLTSSDANVEYMAKNIAGKIESVAVGKFADMSKLPASDTTVGKNDEGKSVYYTFKYTGTVTLLPLVNGGATSVAGGAVGGTTTGYAIAFTVTRTPSEVLA